MQVGRVRVDHFEEIGAIPVRALLDDLHHARGVQCDGIELREVHCRVVVVREQGIFEPHVVERGDFDVVFQEQSEVIVGGGVPALAHRADEPALNDAPLHGFRAVRPIEGMNDVQRLCVHLAVHVERDGNLVTEIVCVR